MLGFFIFLEWQKDYTAPPTPPADAVPSEFGTNNDIPERGTTSDQSEPGRADDLPDLPDLTESSPGNRACRSGRAGMHPA